MSASSSSEYRKDLKKQVAVKVSGSSSGPSLPSGSEMAEILVLRNARQQSQPFLIHKSTGTQTSRRKSALFQPAARIRSAGTPSRPHWATRSAGRPRSSAVAEFHQSTEMGVRKVKSEVARNEKAAKMEPKRGESEDDALDGLADGLADSEAADRKAAGDEAAERKPSGPPPFVALERCVLACHEELVKDLEDEDVEPACRCSGLEKRPCASGSTCENRAMLVECHECRHGERCHNQRFQRRKYTRTEVRAAGAKGFGLFAVEEIPRGALILEFVGEIIDFLEFKSRMEAAAATGQHLYFMQRDAVTAIDATECGNSGRFINHSCEPNSITERWTIKDRLLDVRMRGEMSTKEITSKAIGFFAMREIAAGEEIVYDYQLKGFGGYNHKCLCGAPTCRGFISTVAEPAASDSDGTSDRMDDGEDEDKQQDEDEDEEEDEEDEEEDEEETEEEEQSSSEEDPSFDPFTARPKRRSQPKKRKRESSAAADSDEAEVDEPPVRGLQFAASEQNRVWLNAYRIPKRAKVAAPPVVVVVEPAAAPFGQSNGAEPPNPAVVEAAAPVDPFGDGDRAEDFKREPTGESKEPVDPFADSVQPFESIVASGEPVDPFGEPADLPQEPKDPVDPFADPKEPVVSFEEPKMPVDPFAEPMEVDNRQSAVERWLEQPDGDVQTPMVDGDENSRQEQSDVPTEVVIPAEWMSPPRPTFVPSQQPMASFNGNLESIDRSPPPARRSRFGPFCRRHLDAPRLIDAPPRMSFVRDRGERRDERQNERSRPGRRERGGGRRERSGERRKDRKKTGGSGRRKAYREERLARKHATGRYGEPPIQWRAFGRGSSTSPERPVDADAPKTPPLLDDRRDEPKGPKTPPGSPPRSPTPSDRSAPPSATKHDGIPLVLSTRAPAEAQGSPPKQTRVSPPAQARMSRCSPPRRSPARSPIRSARAAAPAASTRRSYPPPRSSPAPRSSSSRESPPASSASTASSSSKDPRTKQDLLRAKFLQRKREVDSAASSPKSPVPPPPPPPQVVPPLMPGTPLPFVWSPIY